MPATQRIPRVGFVSLGCPKALVDSERILTRLRAEGYDLSPTYEGADLVVVNTCGFIDSAVEESLDAIGEALAENGRVIVTGCLGAKGTLVKQTHPQVLAVTGPHALDEVMAAVHRYLPKPHDPFLDLIPPQGLRLTPRHYAYLKISEGCNHRCTFCIIPTLRGKLVSRPVSEVMREAEALVNAGVKELLIIAQDVSAYGVDVKYRTGFWRGRPVKTRFTDLVRALSELGVWVRLHYVYPYPHVDEVLPLMAQGKILPYLDVPFQHASPRILKRMRRPASGEDNLKRIQAWRAQVPELTIRSTFIVGFPGETEADFEALLEFLEEAQLDRVGCFAYSPVEGAAANALPDPVPEEVKEERRARLMQLQERVSRQRLARKVGSTVPVLIDQVAADHAVGRSPGEAPDIDGVVIVEGAEGLKPGDLLEVTITASDTHDLRGVPLQKAGRHTAPCPSGRSGLPRSGPSAGAATPAIVPGPSK
ncbi:30S ribosomal protein S12 methylthiotransferase RimO [Pelomicrobium methylotrophicum]|uniref:Ribosomal protein uS12 methylthiotransferase RimO n=1 Tax=Pelomicrobium methylotrophicum TaxID=2602750 RepID=A0A5C7EK48_9PROT|nr:30S ribosomal protein S12 methylthiotransferase RimO [Pelomicrobium methylotrophicum]TXF11724.1 30S ribosomal protein S12 methylthiotransferase RimO [Pelomicrobium methylotrophicum]